MQKDCGKQKWVDGNALERKFGIIFRKCVDFILKKVFYVHTRRSSWTSTRAAISSNTWNLARCSDFEQPYQEKKFYSLANFPANHNFSIHTPYFNSTHQLFSGSASGTVSPTHISIFPLFWGEGGGWVGGRSRFSFPFATFSLQHTFTLGCFFPMPNNSLPLTHRPDYVDVLKTRM